MKFVLLLLFLSFTNAIPNCLNTCGGNCAQCSPGYARVFSGTSVVCQACTSPAYNVDLGVGCSDPLFYSLQPCVACGAGSYYASPGQCTQCPAGTMSATVGATSSVACVSCAVGHYSSLQGSTTCTACSATYYAPSAGSTTCTVCPGGTYSSIGASSCTNYCPQNTFSNAGSGCLSCSVYYGPGAGSSAGSSACNYCHIGTYAPPGYVATGDSLHIGSGLIVAPGCALCPAGKYGSTGHQTICNDCPVGTYSVAYGAMSISTCVACSSLANTNQCFNTNPNILSNCYNNNPRGYGGTLTCGSYGDIWAGSSSYSTQNSLTGATSCGNCPPNYGAIGAGGVYIDPVICEYLVVCIPCQPGTSNALWTSYLGVDFSTSNQGEPYSPYCTTCAAGTYAPSPGSPCLTCPNGYTSNAGSASCSIPCPAGDYGVGGVCYACPAQQNTLSAGQTSCTSCSPGQYSPSVYPNCVNCPAGFYSDSTAIGCQQCPPFTSQLPGKTFCGSCPPGQYFDGSVCRTCTQGTNLVWNSFPGCLTACPTGYFTNVNGNCQLNPAGSFISNGASSQCPVNTYSPYLGMYSCFACSAGSFSVAGSSSCVVCSAGTYIVQTSTSASCVNCQPGFFSNQTGQSFCFQCSNGTYQNVSGQTSCVTCPANSVTVEKHPTYCVYCSSGTIAKNNTCVFSATSGQCSLFNGQTTQCNAPTGGVCDPYNNTCQCFPGYSPPYCNSTSILQSVTTSQPFTCSQNLKPVSLAYLQSNTQTCTCSYNANSVNLTCTGFNGNCTCPFSVTASIQCPGSASYVLTNSTIDLFSYCYLNAPDAPTPDGSIVPCLGARCGGSGQGTQTYTTAVFKNQTYCSYTKQTLICFDPTPCTSTGCVTSAWSLFSGCSTTCGVGLQTRYRSILVNSSACNGVSLTQTQDCVNSAYCVEDYNNSFSRLFLENICTPNQVPVLLQTNSTYLGQIPYSCYLSNGCTNQSAACLQTCNTSTCDINHCIQIGNTTSCLSRAYDYRYCTPAEQVLYCGHSSLNCFVNETTGTFLSGNCSILAGGYYRGCDAVELLQACSIDPLKCRVRCADIFMSQNCTLQFVCPYSSAYVTSKTNPNVVSVGLNTNGNVMSNVVKLPPVQLQLCLNATATCGNSSWLSAPCYQTLQTYSEAYGTTGGVLYPGSCDLVQCTNVQQKAYCGTFTTQCGFLCLGGPSNCTLAALNCTSPWNSGTILNVWCNDPIAQYTNFFAPCYKGSIFNCRCRVYDGQIDCFNTTTMMWMDGVHAGGNSGASIGSCSSAQLNASCTLNSSLCQASGGIVSAICPWSNGTYTTTFTNTNPIILNCTAQDAITQCGSAFSLDPQGQCFKGNCSYSPFNQSYYNCQNFTCVCPNTFPSNGLPCASAYNVTQCTPQNVTSYCGFYGLSCQLNCTYETGVNCTTNLYQLGETCNCVNSSFGPYNNQPCGGIAHQCDVQELTCSGPLTSSCISYSPWNGSLTDQRQIVSSCFAGSSAIGPGCQIPLNATLSQCNPALTLSTCGHGEVVRCTAYCFGNSSCVGIPELCVCGLNGFNYTHPQTQTPYCDSGTYRILNCSASDVRGCNLCEMFDNPLSGTCDVGIQCLTNCTAASGGCSVIQDTCYNNQTVSYCNDNDRIKYCGADALSCTALSTWNSVQGVLKTDYTTIECNCNTTDQAPNTTLCVLKENQVSACGLNLTNQLCPSDAYFQFAPNVLVPQGSWDPSDGCLYYTNRVPLTVVNGTCPGTFTVRKCTSLESYIWCNSNPCRASCNSANASDCRLFSFCPQTRNCTSSQVASACGFYGESCLAYDEYNAISVAFVSNPDATTCLFNCSENNNTCANLQFPLTNSTCSTSRELLFCGASTQVSNCVNVAVDQVNCTCYAGYGNPIPFPYYEPTLQAISPAPGVSYAEILLHPYCSGVLRSCNGSSEIELYAGAYAESCSLYCHPRVIADCALASYSCLPNGFPVMRLGQLASSYPYQSQILQPCGVNYQLIANYSSNLSLIQSICGRGGVNASIYASYDENLTITSYFAAPHTCVCLQGYYAGDTYQCENAFYVRQCSVNETQPPYWAFTKCNYTCELECFPALSGQRPEYCFDQHLNPCLIQHTETIDCPDEFVVDLCGTEAIGCTVGARVSNLLGFPLLLINGSQVCECPWETSDKTTCNYAINQTEACNSTFQAVQLCGPQATSCLLQLYELPDGTLTTGTPPTLVECICQPGFGYPYTSNTVLSCGTDFQGDICDIEQYCGQFTSNVTVVCSDDLLDCQPICNCLPGTGSLLGIQCNGIYQVASQTQLSLCYNANGILASEALMVCNADTSYCEIAAETCVDLPALQPCTDAQAVATCGGYTPGSSCLYSNELLTPIVETCVCSLPYGLIWNGTACSPFTGWFDTCTSDELAECGTINLFGCRARTIYYNPIIQTQTYEDYTDPIFIDSLSPGISDIQLMTLLYQSYIEGVTVFAAPTTGIPFKPISLFDFAGKTPIRIRECLCGSDTFQAFQEWRSPFSDWENNPPVPLQYAFYLGYAVLPILPMQTLIQMTACNYSYAAASSYYGVCPTNHQNEICNGVGICDTTRSYGTTTGTNEEPTYQVCASEIENLQNCADTTQHFTIFNPADIAAGGLCLDQSVGGELCILGVCLGNVDTPIYCNPYRICNSTILDQSLEGYEPVCYDFQNGTNFVITLGAKNYTLSIAAYQAYEAIRVQFSSIAERLSSNGVTAFVFGLGFNLAQLGVSGEFISANLTDLVAQYFPNNVTTINDTKNLLGISIALVNYLEANSAVLNYGESELAPTFGGNEINNCDPWDFTCSGTPVQTEITYDLCSGISLGLLACQKYSGQVSSCVQAYNLFYGNVNAIDPNQQAHYQNLCSDLKCKSCGFGWTGAYCTERNAGDVGDGCGISSTPKCLGFVGLCQSENPALFVGNASLYREQQCCPASVCELPTGWNGSVGCINGVFNWQYSTCKCNPTWLQDATTGACTISVCPYNTANLQVCQGNGVCQLNGTCHCNTGYFGTECSFRTDVAISNFATNHLNYNCSYLDPTCDCTNHGTYIFDPIAGTTTCQCSYSSTYFWYDALCDKFQYTAKCNLSNAVVQYLPNANFDPNYVHCKCGTNWGGPSCDVNLCPSANGRVCNGIGTCSSTNQCLQYFEGAYTCGDQFRWGGCACNIDLQEYCSANGSSTYCSGVQTIFQLDSSPCKPYFNATLRQTAYKCFCPPERTGQFCESESCPIPFLYNEVLTQPCNGLVCAQNSTTLEPYCDCQINNRVFGQAMFIGDNCQFDVTSSCAYNPPGINNLLLCSNNGVCTPDNPYAIFPSFSCVCDSGYTGVYCERSNCSSPCVYGQCVAAPDGTESTCKCTNPSVYTKTIDIPTCTVPNCGAAFPNAAGTACVCTNTSLAPPLCTTLNCYRDPTTNDLCGVTAPDDPIDYSEAPFPDGAIDTIYKTCGLDGCECGWKYSKTGNYCTSICDVNHSLGSTFLLVNGARPRNSLGIPETIFSTCLCKPGYDPATNCSTTLCKNNATLLNSGTCACQPVYTGNYCNATQCGARGSPNSSSTCACHLPFTGPFCKSILPAYSTYCQNGGSFNDAGACQCPFPYTGAQCNGSLCINGVAVNGSCLCNPNYSGLTCSTLQCPVNSVASNGACVCATGFSGATCNISQCGPYGIYEYGFCACLGLWKNNPADSSRCTSSQCGVYGTPIGTSLTCSCTPPATGTFCTLACVHGIYVASTGTCVCNSGFTGVLCSTNITAIISTPVATPITVGGVNVTVSGNASTSTTISNNYTIYTPVISSPTTTPAPTTTHQPVSSSAFVSYHFNFSIFILYTVLYAWHYLAF